MSNECNLLDQMLLDFQYIDFNFDEEFSGSDSESDSDDINANYRERINRMNPYYSVVIRAAGVENTVYYL